MDKIQFFELPLVKGVNLSSLLNSPDCRKQMGVKPLVFFVAKMRDLCLEAKFQISVKSL